MRVYVSVVFWLTRAYFPVSYNTSSTHLPTHTPTDTYTHTNTHIHTPTDTYTHTNTHTHTHTPTHTHSRTSRVFSRRSVRVVFWLTRACFPVYYCNYYYTSYINLHTYRHIHTHTYTLPNK